MFRKKGVKCERKEQRSSIINQVFWDSIERLVFFCFLELIERETKWSHNCYDIITVFGGNVHSTHVIRCGRPYLSFQIQNLCK